MPASTVESAFVLIDKATGTAKKIQRSLRDVQTAAEGAGEALDRVSGPKEVKELQALADATKGVAGGMRDLSRDERLAATGMDVFNRRVITGAREVDKMRMSVDRLVGSLREL